MANTALAAPFDDSDIKTKHIILMDGNTGTVLYEKGARDRAYPASTTKIMTCILALETGNLDDIVTIPSVTERGSTLGIRRGEKMSLRSLIYGMMLVSGNDCAEAIAVHIGGTKAEFVNKMNEKAKALGMNDTNFIEPSGLHKEEHYSTAYDFAILTKYALFESTSKDDFRAIIKRPVYNLEDSTRKYNPLENSNRLLYTPTETDGSKATSYEYRGAIGVKTGDTDYAMRCLVAAAERNDVTLITVQFYDTEKFDRFKIAARLFDWGFENFLSKPATSLNLPDYVDVPVSNYSFNEELEANGGMLKLDINLADKHISGDKEMIEDIANNPDKIKIELLNQSELVAPIEQGAVVATVIYKYNDDVLFTADAVSSKSVAALGNVAGSTPGAPFLGDITQNNQGTGPWLFLALVGVGLLFIGGIIAYAMARRKRFRRKIRRRARGFSARR